MKLKFEEFLLQITGKQKLASSVALTTSILLLLSISSWGLVVVMFFKLLVVVTPSSFRFSSCVFHVL